jgi:5'-nucleotidase
MLKRALLFFCLAALFIVGAAFAQDEETFTLTIVHTNDEHAHHDAGSDGSGGQARAAAVINQIRAEGGNVLLVDAGDRFTGTLYHQQYRGADNAQLMNLLGFDAMTLGNHEFDEGDDGLAAFISSLDFPVVSANIAVSESNPLTGLFAPFVILDVNGTQVGVIGLTTAETANISSPSVDVTFTEDYAAVVQQYVDALTAQGISHIVLLTHIGYQNDVALASQVSGVDVIVGGHSHTLQGNAYTVAQIGEYPTVVDSASGEPVLVVTAGENSEYLGRLDVEFDTAGVLSSWGGDAIQLSQYITPDSEVEALLTELAGPIEELRSTPVGETTIFLVGDRAVCRAMECNLGSLITDAMRAETGAQIAITNGGGIRSSIPIETDTPADLAFAEPLTITLGDVLTVLPFGNLVATFDLSGADVIASLEHGVSAIGTDSGTGRFPQVSGIRYTFDPSQDVGSRIVSVEVLGEDGEYTPIDSDATYSLVSNDFMRGGGDGYELFATNATNVYDFGRPLDQVLADYIAANSPISPETEGRIIIVGQ